MEKLLEILEDIRDDVDFENETNLVEDMVLTSFDVLQIVTELNDAYDIAIPAGEVNAENFSSLKSICDMLGRLGVKL